MTVHGRGKVRKGKIVLDRPVALPDGTEVEVAVRTVAERRVPSRSAKRGERKTAPPKKLTAAHLDDFASKHPAPQQWWDANDNPFEPEQPADG